MAEKKRRAGEDELISIIRSSINATSGNVVAGIGDDTAVLKLPKGDCELLFTADMLIEGTHFSTAWSSPYQVGWKAVAANVSDIASMGGRPMSAVVSVGIREKNRETVAKHLAEGIAAAARKYGVDIVGGDTVRAEKMTVNVAMTGQVAKGRAIMRIGAKPGDIIFVTGCCGDSAAGLAILNKKGKNDLNRIEKLLTDRHLAPEPSLEAGLAAAASSVVTAMMDLSDGLATDLPRLAERSGAGAVLRIGNLPVSSELWQWSGAAGEDSCEYAFAGGEDFNLLMTAPPQGASMLQNLMAAAGIQLTAVGEIVEGRELKVINKNEKISDWPDKGFRHF